MSNVPEFLTDPSEIMFIRSMWQLSPPAREAMERLMRAVADKESAHAVRVGVLERRRTQFALTKAELDLPDNTLERRPAGRKVIVFDDVKN